VRSTPRTHWRAFVGRFAIALVAVSSLTASGIGGAYWIANDKVDDIPDAKIPDGVLDRRANKGDAANFLIIGSDTRAFVDNARDAESFGDAATQSGQRSDTIMIAHVDPSTKSGLLVSFPRDLWVDIPGGHGAKINSAFNDGPAKVIETIQANFDVPIHHYLEVDFAGFKEIVDAIGTVPIFFPTPARDAKTGLSVPLGGCAKLSGDQALAYVRSRYYEWYDVEQSRWRTDPTSDFGRIRRQQYFMRSIAKAAIDKGGRNPVTAYRLLDEVVKHLVKDPALGLSDLQALANTFSNVDPAVVEMVTVPTARAFHGKADALDLVEGEAAPLFERLRSFGPAVEAPDESPPAGLDPADVRVQVQNGSGVPGIAGDTLTALKAAGFVGVEPPVDADRLDHEVSEIRYAPGAEGSARLVKAYLAGSGKLVRLDVAPEGADVVLVVGSDFTGVYAPGTAPTTTTVVSTTSTTLAANPGTLPGVTTPYDPSSGLPPVGC